MYLMRKVFLSTGLALWLLGLGACDPGAGITWVNRTDQPVNVYFGDSLEDFSLSVAPGSSVEAATIEHVWKDLIVLRDDEGNILFRQELTWDDLKARDFQFVITENMISQAR